MRPRNPLNPRLRNPRNPRNPHPRRNLNRTYCHIFRGFRGAGNLPGAYWRVAVKRFGLSPRESQVLRSIWTGRKFSLAAREVKISRHTLDTHWRRIRLKLEVNSLIEAVHKMYEVLISLQMQELREEVERAARQDVPDDDFAPTSGGP